MSNNKCENCIHFDVCTILMANAKHQTKQFVRKCLNEGGICDRFKDKSLFVELPCKVGTPVYFIDENEIYDGKIVSFIKQHNVVDVFCRYEIGLTYYHNIDDLGKRVFLTKEQAEQKLKELEK